MKSLEESVVTALDGSDRELFPFLPYRLQDIWEIGTDPDVMVRLIGGQFPGRSGLAVLDLGCGKGAVFSTGGGESGLSLFRNRRRSRIRRRGRPEGQ